MISRTFRVRMADIMFKRGQDLSVFALETFDISCGENSGEVWIFGKGFFGPAPTGVACHVQHGSESLSCTDGEEFTADGFANTFDQVGVPRCPIGKGRREQRCSGGHKTGKAFFMGDRWNTEAGFLHQELLQSVERTDALRGGNISCPEGARDLAEPVSQTVIHYVRVRVAREPIGSYFMLAVFGQEEPYRMHLCDLLFQCHARQEVGCPRLDGFTRILVVAHRGLRKAY